MQHDFEKYLWDIHRAGMDILEFTQGKVFSDYQQDSLLRAAVERNFNVIGEAMRQVRSHFPEAAKGIEHGGEIVALRKMLPHEDNSVDEKTVWDITERELPVLIAEVTVLLDEWHQG